MSSLLEIMNLTGGYEENVDVLKGIDLTLKEGETIGVIGLNGSGKSTFGKAILNLLPYRSGEIFFNGQHIESKTTHELAQMGIVMMHQGGAVFPNLSVWHNLSLAGWTEKPKEAYHEQLKEIIPLLRIPKKKLSKTMAHVLSGGERHELALAMTLVKKPKLLILDEPSAGLSPKSLESTYLMLGEIKTKFNLSIILIEQNISRAVAFCEKCVLLEAGTVRYSTPKTDNELLEIERIMFKN